MASFFCLVALMLPSTFLHIVPYRFRLRLDLPTGIGTTVLGVLVPKRGAPAWMASVMKLGARWP